jgi:hypothetical protein
MAMFSKRPAALVHLSDEAAARALSKHFGNVVEAAKELGVDRKDLRRLTWSNPAILDAAHERMSLLIFVQRDEIMSGLASKVASVRRRAIDRLGANPGLFGDLNHPAFALLAPAARTRGPRLLVEDEGKAAAAEEARLELEREAAAELEREAADERERAEVMAERRPSASIASLWPSYIRRPTRGRR